MESEGLATPRSSVPDLLTQTDVSGKSLTLVLVADDGTAVVTGKVFVFGDDLVFEHGDEPFRFTLPDDALERIRSVAPEASEILNGADYFLSLSVGNHDEIPPGNSERTGLKWPSDV